jgi:hypothetical protein
MNTQFEKLQALLMEASYLKNTIPQGKIALLEEDLESLIKKY